MAPLLRNSVLAIFAILAGRLGSSEAAASTRPGQRGTAASLAPRVRQQEPLAERYTKSEHLVPMRDGVRLHTAVYTPLDTSKEWPILMRRTPYSCRPYGKDLYPRSLGPEPAFVDDGYIFVYQDVRGCYLSEGEFVNMRPHVADKRSPGDVDESTDCYDTIEWLLANVPNHNGRVGLYGISYPGFYCAASMIDAHPALKAVSPQAPIADWWFDDFHHHGAFFLPHAFGFLSRFGRARPEPTVTRPGAGFEYWTSDGYAFYLDMTPLRKANEKYLKGEIAFWNEIVAHPNYDEFWQSRNILPHLANVAPAVLTVGGWYDAEDLYGPLKIYRTVEEKNPGIFNALVMGPWAHGGWARGDGESLGHVHFGGRQSEVFRTQMQRPFFRHFLKDEGPLDLPEAFVFETGTNAWRRFDAWPPPAAVPRSLYLNAGQALAWEPDEADGAYDAFMSDPRKPVPFTADITRGMSRSYMTGDQRFAARRPDVLVYASEVLESDVTLAGPSVADLWVSTSGTASDWVVKLIDVYPPDHPDRDDTPDHLRLAGYQQLVRSEVIRGRFRDSYEHPEPFVPNQAAHVELELLDVLHTFREGHRIMVQIQCTWFPLVDLNPHRYAPNVYLAGESDFITAEQRVHRAPGRRSRLRVGVLAD